MGKGNERTRREKKSTFGYEIRKKVGINLKRTNVIVRLEINNAMIGGKKCVKQSS